MSRGGLSFGARLALLLGLAALLLLTQAGAAPLERAEIYFLDGARAMVERADYLVPRYRDEPFFDKPPLTYWLIAAAFRGFGFTLEAARLVPALAALAAILATVWLGAQLFDRETGLLGGLVLATTGAFVSFGRLAMSDMLLAFSSTAAFALGVALLRAETPFGRLALSAFLAMALGLGFLSKGPVALLLPVLGLLALAWQQRSRAQRLAGPAVGVGACVLLAVALPWFVLVKQRLGWQPIGYFFLHENLERFAGETYDSGRSALYYLAVYAAEGLPWSLLFPLALLRLRDGPAPKESPRGAELLAVWIGLMLVPLSLSRGKIDYYLLPVYPAASLLTARFLRSRWTQLETIGVRTSLLLAAGLAALALFAWGGLPSAFLPPPAALASVRVGSGLLAAAFLFAARRPSARVIAGLMAAAGACAALAVTAGFVPALSRAQPNSAIVSDVMRERSFRKDAQLVFCEDPTRVARDLLFRARLASLERCDLWAPAASSFPFLLLVREDQRETLRVATRFVGAYSYVPAAVTSLRTLLKDVHPETLVLLANYSTADPEAGLRMRKDRKRRVRERERREAQGAGEKGVP